jgi:mannose-6-phosphate isomerase-like protein (cupin superfamily)
MDTNSPVPDQDDDALRGADKKEAYHLSREKMVKPFEFRRPKEIPAHHKAFVRLATTDHMNAHVQIISEGGDNNLHYHANMDSLFYVLKGAIRVYGPGDKLIGEFGPSQGCSMPAGARYWFEVARKDEEAWLLHISAYPKGREMSKRIVVDETQPDTLKTIHYDSDTHKVIPPLVKRKTA